MIVEYHDIKYFVIKILEQKNALKINLELGAVAHASIPSENEAGRSPWFQGQPELQT